jgi:dihydroxyacid dehydratase/phosphogluconate dehydratase
VKSNLKTLELSCTRGVLAKYAAHMTSASEGAVTDKDLTL